MRKTITLLAFIIFIGGCERESRQEKIELSDLNLYLKTNVEIDSVLIANFTQDREYQLIPYSDTLNISFNDSINDYYFFKFFTKKGTVMYPLWLNGENVIIKGEITDRLKIDTIIGSDLYYKSIDYRRKYKELNKNKSDSSTINSFLLDMTKQNINSPFSIEPASTFFHRNISDKNKLNILYSILSNQKDVIKNNLNNPYKEIEKILTVDKIDLSKFQFYDIKKNITTIKSKKGKFILLDFWFIECAPCIEQHKLIAKKLEWLKSRNVEVIGISIDKNHKEWKKFLEEKKYSWLNLRELDVSEKSLRTNMLISAFPTYFLIDSEGNILYRVNSFAEMEKHLSK
jgi:peroxiredoxin